MHARPRVLLSVCNTGWIHKHVTRAVARLLMDRRYRVTYIDPTHVPYEHNLNRVVWDLLTKYRDHEYWLNIDADNPPLNNPLDLIALRKEIIGCPTPVWHDAVPGDQPFYYNALMSHGNGWKPVVPQNGSDLIEVDAIGSGCMLIHRRVCETLRKPLFMRQYDERGFVERGHDYLFCKNAKHVGFSVWAHFGYPCRHFCENDIHSQIEAFARQMSEVRSQKSALTSDLCPLTSGPEVCHA